MKYESRIVGGSKSTPLPLDLLECVGLYEALVCQEVAFQVDRQAYALRNENNTSTGARVSSEAVSRKFRNRISASMVRTAMQNLKILGIVVELEPASGVQSALVLVDHERAAQVHEMGWDAAQAILTEARLLTKKRKSSPTPNTADTSCQVADTTSQLADTTCQPAVFAPIIPNKNNNKNTNLTANASPFLSEPQTERVASVASAPIPQISPETALEPQQEGTPSKHPMTPEDRALVQSKSVFMGAWRALGIPFDKTVAKSAYEAMSAHSPEITFCMNQNTVQQWIVDNGYLPRQPSDEPASHTAQPVGPMTKPIRHGNPVQMKNVPPSDKHGNKIPEVIRRGFNADDMARYVAGEYFENQGMGPDGRPAWSWSKDPPKMVGYDDVVKMMKNMGITKERACTLLGVDPARFGIAS